MSITTLDVTARLVADLSHVALAAYGLHKAFAYFTARLAAHGAEPVVIERTTPEWASTTTITGDN